MSDDGDYKVGRGKPPLHSRFKKGECANPRGRPRGSLNVATTLKREALKRLPVTEGGKRASKTKLEIIVAQFINKAAGGDLKAGMAAMERLEQIERAEARATADKGAVDTATRKALDAELLRDFRNRLLTGKPATPTEDGDGPED